jgi:hypothetical protein
MTTKLSASEKHTPCPVKWWVDKKPLKTLPPRAERVSDGGPSTGFVPFTHGDRGYIKGSDRFVGLYVGVNPETDSLVFVFEAAFKCYHKGQVSKEQNKLMTEEAARQRPPRSHTLPPRAERDAMADKWVCTVPGCSETVYKPGPCQSCRDRFGDERAATD